ncbi:hypothetical protein FCL47_22270 [Desulfopila sp. IMCC35006]|uniref:hypothetical protein n=1 Tax=Desulfopila sp. IMCC35006 TaxID=2569542 RepID=UPI0010AD5D7F|nr:hypothetical protein [Desulfopila sp. IMCC35006]TKB23483.1 hypothetical protein FCL47_22270 [Desulfopila sp. IMCC35006]
MPNWLIEILAVIALSKRTQWAIIFGCIFFIGINLLGSHVLSDFELHGPAAGLTDAIKQKMAKMYDKIAWGALFSFWALAFKFYRKDKNRFW